MFSGTANSIRRWTTLVVGLALLASMFGSVQATSLYSPASSPDDTVIVPPGDPVEIATIMFWDWDATQDHLDAVQMAMDGYGSIKGFALQRNDYDGGCDFTSGENAATAVVANAQNVGAIGPSCSSSTSGALPVLELAGVVMISHSSTSPSLPPLGPTVFNRVVVDDSAIEGWHQKISGLPSVLAWERGFEQAYGHYPDVFARYAYDATILLLTRIDEVSTVDGGGNLLIDRTALATAVRGTTDFPGITDPISLDNAPGTAGNRLNLLTATGTRYVATSGDDSGGNECIDPATPCATVQRGVALADDGGSVLVAGGTYTENVTIGISLTLEGGYSGSPDWTRSLTLYETLLDGSDGQAQVGDWDGKGVRYPMVIHDGVTYKMWYIGLDLFDTGRVGYATSPDGLNWSKYASYPVLDVGAAGEWDEAGLEAAFVRKEGSTYKMWYSGRDASGVWRIGYATSSNGITWTKHASNPVLDLGQDDWNNSHVLHPYVLDEGGTYKMWLVAIGDAGGGIAPHMAYATSSDGISWAWDAANPLFGRDWEMWLWRPDVRNTGAGYQMWYSAWVGEGAVAYATSPDETTWTKQGTVLTGTVGMWDEGAAVDPYVLYEGGVYSMWYDNNTAIGVVTSTDGISWTQFISNPVLMPGDLGNEGLSVVSVEGVQVVLDGLTITGGTAERAGGVDGGEGDITIRHCKVRDNVAYGDPDSSAGGGVSAGQPLTIEDSWILDNQVGAGASGVRGKDVYMVNTVVAGNSGDAAIHVNGDLALTNVTVTDNDSDIIFNPESSASLTMTNTIVYSHTNRQLDYWCSQFSCNVNYSDVEGGWSSGSGNIDQDPLFADAATGDYHLQGHSPCIDAGTPDGAPVTDIEGTPRDAIPDMGAYEGVAELYQIYLPIVVRH